jgi:hypothetical protein
MAESLAAAEAAGSATSPTVVVRSERLASGVAQAGVWLATQPAPRDLGVVSDFQVGALVLSDLEVVPADAGVRLWAVAVDGPVPAVPAPARARLRVLVGPEHARDAAAAEAAARLVVENELGGGSSETASELISIALIFPSAPDHAALLAAAGPIRTPEAFDLAADIQGQLGHAPVADLRQISDERMSGLAVFTNAAPGRDEAASLMAAILRAAQPPALPAAEREPDTLGAATLEAWQREAAPAAAPARQRDRSDGRWLWAVVLVLLALETVLRRAPAAVRPREVAGADAA